MGPAHLMTEEDVAVRKLAFNGGFGTVSPLISLLLLLFRTVLISVMVQRVVSRTFSWNFCDHRGGEG